MSENYEIRMGGTPVPTPMLGGELTDEQLDQIEVWTHVPPFDGFILSLGGTAAADMAMFREMLIGFRGNVMSEVMAIEYLLAAIPLADELKGEDEYNEKFWSRMNNNKSMFHARIQNFKKWIDGQFLEITEENFDAATSFLLDVRNSLAHYPVQGAFDGTNNTLKPFVYRASKKQMFIFDTHKLTVISTWLTMLKSELDRQYQTLQTARKTL